MSNIVSGLVLDPGVIVSKVSSTPGIALLSLNRDVVYGIDDTPNTVTGVTMAAAGGISGVERENVIVEAPDYAAGAAWGDAEIDGGQGRLAVFMDANWLGSYYNADSENRNALIENLARFLTVR